MPIYRQMIHRRRYIGDGYSWPAHWSIWEGSTAIGCDVNKSVKSSLHYEKVKIWKSDFGIFNITQINKNWQKKLQSFLNKMVFTRKKSIGSRCKQNLYDKWTMDEAAKFDHMLTPLIKLFVVHHALINAYLQLRIWLIYFHLTPFVWHIN